MTTEPERHAARPRRSAARAEHPAAKLESSAVESERFEAGHERSTAAPAHPSAKSEILEGLRLSLAAGLGMYPLGIAFGLLVIQAGLPWWVAPALSTAGYAGSLELLLIGMITSGTALGTIALTTFLVNFRHVFYAFSFPLRAITGKFTRFYSMYALTDESYAVTAVDPENWTARKLLTVQIAFQCYWVGGGLTGVALGSLISEPIDGLDFALCALYHHAHARRVQKRPRGTVGAFGGGGFFYRRHPDAEFGDLHLAVSFRGLTGCPLRDIESAPYSGTKEK